MSDGKPVLLHRLDRPPGIIAVVVIDVGRPDQDVAIKFRESRRRRLVAHRNVMIAALVCSVLFLTSYLIYHAQVGSKHFPGTGTARTVYLSILLTHTVLAATVPFLAVVTVWRAGHQRYALHKKIARWTLPIWLYVSVTGVVVYWMLYRMTW